MLMFIDLNKIYARTHVQKTIKFTYHVHRFDCLLHTYSLFT